MSDSTNPHNPHGLTIDDMVDGVYRDIATYLDEASEHLTLQLEVLHTRLQDTRKAGEIPTETTDDMDLVVQALACVERARHDLATRHEREEFTREMFERMTALTGEGSL